MSSFLGGGGGGGGAVSSVTANDTTVTISPTTGAVLVQVNLAKANHWTNTTDASSISTGAIITDGGIGIAKSLWVGGNLDLVTIGSVTSTAGSISWAGARPLFVNQFGDFFWGGGNFTSSAGGGNVGIGNTTLHALTTGTSNLCFGQAAGNAIKTGSSNVIIGPSAGTNYTSSESFNLLIGPTAGTTGESSTIQFADGGGTLRWDFGHTNAGAWSTANALVIGTATGGNLGNGTINVSSGISLNNTAYTNPDYVLEHYHTGKVSRFAAKPKAQGYPGLMPLKDLRDFTEKNWHLPRISREPSDIFERGDMALEKIEELTLYILELESRIAALEAR